jgi:hypothetical protein
MYPEKSKEMWLFDEPTNVRISENREVILFILVTLTVEGKKINLREFC